MYLRIILGVVIGKVIYHFYKAHKCHKRNKEHQEEIPEIINKYKL